MRRRFAGDSRVLFRHDTTQNNSLVYVSMSALILTATGFFNGIIVTAQLNQTQAVSNPAFSAEAHKQ